MFKNMALAGAIAFSSLFTATHADALNFPLSGVFNIEAFNYTVAGGDNDTRRANSFATVANFDDIAALSPTIGTVVESASFTYEGALDFNLSGSNQTIGAFLGSGSGTVDGVDPSFAGRTLSAGSFTTATLFRITALSLNIADLSNLVNVFHDDGISVFGSGGTSVVSAAPTTRKETQLFGKLTGGVEDFTLIYAAANGNPSVLEVNAIPLPAALWLLLGASGGLIIAKRRSARESS